jgi:hypothetical protein
MMPPNLVQMHLKFCQLKNAQKWAAANALWDQMKSLFGDQIYAAPKAQQKEGVST